MKKTYTDDDSAPRGGALSLHVEGPRALASTGRRYPALDLLRVAAIVCAVAMHTLPGEGVDRLWKDLPCVATMGVLFMVSGALLLPLAESTGQFISRRLRRVFIPIAVWSAVYAAVYRLQGEWSATQALWAARDILFRSTFPPGWFCYAIGGIYLFAPVISPWLRQAGRRQIEAYLLIWAVSLNIPYLAMDTEIFAGLFAMFFNCMGYCVLGVYLVHYAIPRAPSWRVWLPALVILTAYPLAVRLRHGWWAYSAGFGITPNCAEAALGIPVFVIVWKLFGGWRQGVPATAYTPGPGGIAAGARRAGLWLLRELSLDSFGLYLIHWLFVFQVLYRYFPGWEPSWSTFALTLAVCFPVAAALRRVPVVGKYLAG